MTEKGLVQLLYDLQIDRCDDWYAVRNAIADKGIPAEDFHVSDGASKICLIFNDLPFVVKWSYYEDDTDNYDEAMEEVKIYQKACQAGLEFFFPKTQVLCRFNDIAFIKQEKVSLSVSETRGKDVERKLQKIGKNASDKIVEKMEKEFHKVNGYRRHLSRLWAKAALVIYGKRKCKALCKFVVDNDINDLHERNIGFMGINPIVLDFSGYHRSSSWS